MEHEWIRRKLLIRDLIQSLEEHPHVLSVANKYHYIKVTFDTGITEYWALTKKGLERFRSYKLPFNQAYFTDHEIPSFKQFETNKLLYLEDYEILKHHFIIKKKDLDKAGWCDIRFKAHDLAVDLAEEGYVPIQYTDEILDEDLKALRDEDLSRYQHSLIRFSAFSFMPPSGRRLIMHFMPCYAEKKWDFYSIYKTINKLLHRDFTREDVVYYLSKEYQTTKHPAFYRALFQQWFDIKGKSVYDLCPAWGFKALAVMIEGGDYHCNNPHLKHLKKMGEYIGGNVSSPDQSHYDLIILSDTPVGLSSVDSLICNFRGVSDYLMITVRINAIDEWRELISRYKPERVLRFNSDMINDAKSDNMIMIIRS